MSDAFRVPVIMAYHSVEDVVTGGRIYRNAIAVTRFERHIAFLTAHYRFVPLTNFVEALASRSKAEGMACLTMDDGYIDSLTAARDILCRHCVPTTMFIPTGFVGREYFWWDALHEVLRAGSCQPDAIRRELNALLPSMELHAGISHEELSLMAWDRMRRSSLDESYRLVDEFAARLKVPLDGCVRPVKSDELSQLAKWPFEIGSHAVSHRSLPTLTIGEVRDELLQSRAFLETRIGRPVRTLSYPFGLFDNEVAQATRETGYSSAVSLATDYRLVYWNAFGLPRVDGGDDDLDGLITLLRRYEERNAPLYAVTGQLKTAPIAASPALRSKFSAAHSAAVGKQKTRGYELLSPVPVSRNWGYDSGVPLDRPFIERFVRTHIGDLYGRVLEVKEPEYAGQFARPGARVDILDINPDNISADIIDDLQVGAKIEDNAYNCLILTQVLQLIPDFDAALATSARILRPGGALLLTAPGITQGVASNEGKFYWSFFEPGLRRALSKYFDPKRLLINSHGNVGLAASFLMGQTVGQVPADLFSYNDPEYPLVLSARAVKPEAIPDHLSWTPVTEGIDTSVIIPMLNAAGTIRETLYSVSRQNYARYEILIIDDGSTDASRKIVEEIARESHGRITVLNHSDNANRGLSESRNLGLQHARGEFIVFLDADDNIHPEKLSHNIEILRRHPEVAALVGRAMYWWDGSGVQPAYLDTILEPSDRVAQPPEFFHATYQLGTGGGVPCVHSWMVRKSFLKMIEPFDTNMMTYEDQKFLAELSLRFPIYVSSACLCEYRRSENTLWARAVSSGTDAAAKLRFEHWKDGIVRVATAYPRRGAG